MISKEIDYITKQLKETPLVKKTKNKLTAIWNEHQNEFKYLFGLRLFQYAQGKHYDLTTDILPSDKILRTKTLKAYRGTNRSSSAAKQFQRLSIGYNGLNYEFTPYRCRLSSKAANDNPKDTVKDHIIGATLAAEYVKYIFQNGQESKNIDWIQMVWLNDRISYMCNTWLKDNLWLWAQCRITKKEHNPKTGVKRNFPEKGLLKEIYYKANLLHYKDATINVCEYKSKASYSLK